MTKFKSTGFSRLDSSGMSVGGIFTEVSSETPLEGMKSEEDVMAVLPLRNLVVFPFIPIPIQIEREASLNAVRESYESGRPVFLVCQKDPAVESPGVRDLYRVGTVCAVVRIIEMDDSPTTAFVFPLERAKLVKLVQKTPFLSATVRKHEEIVPDPSDSFALAMIEELDNSYRKLLEMVNEVDDIDLRFNYDQFKDRPIHRVGFIAMNSPISIEKRQKLIEESDIKKRLVMLLTDLDIARQEIEIRAEIKQRTRVDLTQQQREMFLHQQMRTIQSELGGVSSDSDENDLARRAESKNWSEKAKAHFQKELSKLGRYNPQSPEYAVQYTYLDTFLNLPWDSYSVDDFSLDNVKETLDRDHYGLEKVKERIVEHCAVLKLRNDMKAPILCLYGPPGVGKTSLGKSVASALGRKYARVSLGGLHDEAEIRGHRRTYIGAMPGRILTALEKCGTGNPVFVLDEIDKIGADYKGDPAQALLEVLDPEQNNRFHDNFVDFDYDLSQILFIATANDISRISRPLLDRMEIIEITGYTVREKLEIARRHLVCKIMADHGLGDEGLSLTDEALTYIIEYYTRESGVRALEKKLAAVARKLACLKASGNEIEKIVDVDRVKEFLGKEQNYRELYENNDFAGVVTGLAWTGVGGEVLYIESSLNPGKGEKLTLTGNLGDVMKESAVIALQWIKANGMRYGITSEHISGNDVHIHVPEGAVPKDGPSAGVTMVTSLASAFTHRKVRARLAMTGEITLRGKVLPVGGIKEKLLAARRAGITDIIICSQNRRDVEEIDEQYLEGLIFHYVDNVDEVLDFALLEEKADK